MAHSGTIIYMETIPEKPDWRRLSKPLPLKTMSGETGFVPEGFPWDGSSVLWLFQWFFPRHRHPIASCRHDWRCKCAKNAAERKWADQQFRKDVRTTSWAITSTVAYLGVRIGAFLGIGNRF